MLDTTLPILVPEGEGYPEAVTILLIACFLGWLVDWWATTTFTSPAQNEVNKGQQSPQTREQEPKTPRSEDFFNSPYDKAGMIEVQGRDIPWTMTAPDYSDCERSFLVSPYSQYVSYAQDEINKNYAKHSPLTRWVGNAILSCLGFVLRLMRLDDCIFFNNWLLTTSLWPSTINWSEQQIQEINETLLQETGGSTDKAIIWRCIDPLSQPTLATALSESSCVLVPSRVVNWIDLGKEQLKKHLSKKRDLRRDMKLCKERAGWDMMGQKTVEGGENSELEIVAIEPEDMTMEIAEKLIVLYDKLYLEKYSKNNPQQSPQGLYRMVRSGLIALYILRLRSEPERFLSFAGGYDVDDVAVFPVAGYDTDSPRKDLYRLLIAMTFHHAFRTGKDKQHMSGGVSGFKRNRGATSTVEYSAVFVDHLPLYRRWGWKLLKLLAEKIITVEHAK